VTAPIDPSRNPGNQGIGFEKKIHHSAVTVTSRNTRKATASANAGAGARSLASDSNVGVQRKHIGPLPKRVKVSELINEELEGKIATMHY
jgi:hypothetical protein